MKTKIFLALLITFFIVTSFSDVMVENGMVSFYFESDTASSVSLIGTFNNWDPFANPMKGEDDEWFTQLKLKPGVYQYAFLINGVKTVEDPNEYGSIKNDLGTYNSVFVLKLSNSKLVIDAQASRDYAKTLTEKKKEEKKSEVKSELPEGYESNTPKDAKLSPFIKDGKVVFSFKDSSDVKSVCLAGSFNSWSSNSLAMTKNDSVWQTFLNLKDGIYQYKFVINGSKWKEDPNSYGYAPDGYGGKNSVLIIKNSKIFIPQVKEKAKKAVIIEKTKKVVKAGPSVENGYVIFRLKYPSASKVNLAGTFNNWNSTALAMKLVDDYWEAKVKLNPGSYEYKFVVDGSTWIEDPNAFEYVPDPYGGKNSVITLKNENGKLVIVKPSKKKETSLLSGEVNFKFAANLNSVGFSPEGYNLIGLQISPKIANTDLKMKFSVNTNNWSVNFAGLNLRMKNSPFVLDVYNSWQEPNIDFLNSGTVEASTIGVYGKAFGVFGQMGNVGNNVYYGFGMDKDIGFVNLKVGYFDKDFSSHSFGYENPTIAVQGSMNIEKLGKISNELDLVDYKFQKETFSFENDLASANITYQASKIEAKLAYNYNFNNLNGKVAVGYADSSLLGYLNASHTFSKGISIKSNLKYLSNNINWNTVLQYSKENTSYSIFLSNLPISVDSIYDDFQSYSETSINVGFEVNSSF